MRFGLGVLRLSPEQFWAMTPREIAAAMDAFGGQEIAPPDPTTFAALQAAFPDRQSNRGHSS